MRALTTRLLALLIALGAIGAVYYASTKEQAQKAAGQRRGGGDLPVPVTAATVARMDMPVFLEGVGTARPAQSVTVRPQVDGKILKLHFREGQMITRGDLLAEIDGTTYKAQLDQSVARRALTETQLTNARRDLDRYLRIPGVVAQKTVDTQSAQVQQLEAQIKADDATIANARAILDYTRITAPISGRTGLRQVDEGNLVRAAGDTGLVTISQLQPISVLFTLPQQNLQAVKRAEAAGPVTVEALDADGKTVLDTGVLQVVDNQVDQTTGTVKMKAEFANATQQLWPGQFVNVRLLVETLPQVVVVPTPAVQRGPNGPFVFVIADEERARMRPIETQMQTETTSVIKTGLTGGERVITSGFARLADNARVIAGNQGGEPPQAKAPKATKEPQAGSGARFERIRQACGTELTTVCAGVQREGMRDCMTANKAKFSATCQAAMDAGAEGRGSEGRGKRSDAPAVLPTPVSTSGAQKSTQ